MAKSRPEGNTRGLVYIVRKKEEKRKITSSTKPGEVSQKGVGCNELRRKVKSNRNENQQV